MTKHKFATGDRVLATSNGMNPNLRPGVYTIVKALPVAGFGHQYRAKSTLDSHERVIDEASLRAFNG